MAEFDMIDFVSLMMVGCDAMEYIPAHEAKAYGLVFEAYQDALRLKLKTEGDPFKLESELLKFIRSFS